MPIHKKRLFLIGTILIAAISLLGFFFYQNKNELPVTPPNEIPRTESLLFSSRQLSDRLEKELSGYLPFDEIAVTFSENGTVTLYTSLKKEDVVQLLEKKQPSLRYVGALLPDPIDTLLSLQISAKENRLHILPTALRVASFDLTSWITKEQIDALNRKVSQYFETKQIDLLALQVFPDAISMKIHRKFT